MSSVTGRTTLVGLFGWPVSHSVSPAMHNAAFAELGMNWCYVPMPVSTEPGERIGEAVRGLRAMGFRGANVTVPHKQNVMPYLDWLTPAAKAIGAVNTIIVEGDGSLTGDNTDAPGFIADLRAHHVDPRGKRIIVLGAGGSARAVVCGLAEAGAREIMLFNRTQERAEVLAAEMWGRFPDTRFAAHQLPDDITRTAEYADIIVNCTSLGMTPKVEGLPWLEEISFSPSQVVYDLVYNPMETRLLALARGDGATGIDGLGMLIWQAALAFERWTGQKPSVSVMEEAALKQFGLSR
ncbi:MAG: shikimate dehydrogenase [Caldilineaceae bacterium]